MNVPRVKFVTKTILVRLKAQLLQKNRLQTEHLQEHDLFLKEDADKKKTDEIPEPRTSLVMVKR